MGKKRVQVELPQISKEALEELMETIRPGKPERYVIRYTITYLVKNWDGKDQEGIYFQFKTSRHPVHELDVKDYYEENLPAIVEEEWAIKRSALKLAMIATIKDALIYKKLVIIEDMPVRDLNDKEIKFLMPRSITVISS
jgi:hypothetical protein